MKATLWIGAAALAALFAAGCEDDRALGTERNQDTPITPAPPAPYRNPALKTYEGVDQTPPSLKEPTATATDNAKAKELTPNDGSKAVDSSKATMDVVDVENGEDLSRIPDLNGPLWGP